MCARVFSCNLPQLLWLNSTLRFSFHANFLSLCFCRFQQNSKYMHHCSHANLLFPLPLPHTLLLCVGVCDANFKDAPHHCSNDALISWNWPKYNRNFHSSESVPISLECIAVHCIALHVSTHKHTHITMTCVKCAVHAPWMQNECWLKTKPRNAMQCNAMHVISRPSVSV